MGSSSSKPTRTVKFVVDGMDELDVRLDDLESKFDDTHFCALCSGCSY